MKRDRVGVFNTAELMKRAIKSCDSIEQMKKLAASLTTQTPELERALTLIKTKTDLKDSDNSLLS